MSLHTRICALAAACALGAGATLAHAAITVNQSDSITGSAGFSHWLVTPNAADSTGAASLNLAAYSTAEGNFGGSPVSALAESFAATASGKLTDLEITVTGTTTGTVSLALYDAGSATGSPLADTGSNSYVPGGTTSGSSIGVSANLLAADSTGITLPGYNTSGANAAIYDFSLSGADAVSLVAGEEYVLELSNPSAALDWFRNSATATEYSAGQAFRAEGSLNGNNNRDFAMAAVVAVPEPASLSLVGAACLGLMARRRRA